jgi:hypothetical protein
MPTIARVPSGQLLIRTTAANQSALVGVVELPAEFVVRENAAYLLLLVDGAAEIADAALDGGLPEELEGQGIEAALRAPIWRRTKVPGALCVRFFAALPEQRRWVVYGATDTPIPDATPGPCDTDLWLTIARGLTRRTTPPASSRGYQLSQMLTGHAIWPDALGERHAFPQHTPTWRAHYHRLSKLMARCGAGEFSAEELQQRLRADPALDCIRPWHLDAEYLRYLARLDAAGELVPAAPRAAAAQAAYEERVKALAWPAGRDGAATSGAALRTGC